VVVAPREQFRVTRPALESIFAQTGLPYKLVYVDGASPAPVQRYLKLRARQRGFTLIRTEHYISPTEARALALPHVDTPYVCFIDNDVIVTRGWLDRLVRCADETDAWAVGPLYCNGVPALRLIHMAGGQAHIREENGRRAFYEKHRFWGRPAAEVQTHLRREATELVEYHCMLLRTETFDKFGPQDPRYLSSAESLDICLQLRGAGYPVYLEPDAVVSNQPPPPFLWTDLPFYLLRWSDAWNRISLRCFRERWDLPADDRWIGDHYGWLTRHRDLAFEWVAQGTRRVLGWRRGGRLARLIVEPIHRHVVRQAFRHRPALVECERQAPRPAASSPR
jgi:glycosyltransferase involved in cell wall biosynthesis